MAGDFNVALCDQKHTDMERRMSHVEQTLSQNLEKLYNRLDEINDDYALLALKRLPVWTTALISLLSAAVVGLLVASIK